MNKNILPSIDDEDIIQDGDVVTFLDEEEDGWHEFMKGEGDLNE